MPECIVCKGYYEAERRCQEAERLHREAEQRRKEVEQCRNEAERLCKEAKQCRKKLERCHKKAEQRCRKAEQRYQEAGRRCREVERHYKEAEQRRKEAVQRYRKAEQRCNGAAQCREEVQRLCKEAEQGREEVQRLCKEAEQRLKDAAQCRKKAEQRCRKAEQHRQDAERWCRKAEQRRQDAERRCKEVERCCKEAEHRCEKVKHPCERCDSDNSAWERWRRFEPVERGGLRGVLAFTEPHFHIPFLVAVLSTVFGLLALFTLWMNIKPGFRAIALLVTPAGCLISLQGMYEARMQIREREMLRQVKRGWRKGISAQMVTLLLPAVAVGVVLLLILALVKIDVLWELVKWLALVHPVETGDSLPEKFIAVLPFTSLMGYVMLAIGFTASSSLMLARRYMNRLNEFLQHPIFAQTEKLAEIVRKEAEVELGRLNPKELHRQYPKSANISLMGYMQIEEQADLQLLRLPPSVDMSTAVEGPLSPQFALWGQAATWVWDELERTGDGGIEMKVARQEIYQLPRPTEKSGHRPHPRVSYTVCADPWGRIIEIKRDEDQTEQSSNYR